MLESPDMFGSLPLDPNNDWIKLSKLVPWREFDLKYAAADQTGLQSPV